MALSVCHSHPSTRCVEWSPASIGVAMELVSPELGRHVDLRFATLSEKCGGEILVLARLPPRIGLPVHGRASPAERGLSQPAAHSPHDESASDAPPESNTDEPLDDQVENSNHFYLRGKRPGRDRPPGPLWSAL